MHTVYTTTRIDDGRFAVQNTNDLTLLKSKESGAVIAFEDESRAQLVADFFQKHYDQIVVASQTWWVKENGEMKKLTVL